MFSEYFLVIFLTNEIQAIDVGDRKLVLFERIVNIYLFDRIRINNDFDYFPRHVLTIRTLVSYFPFVRSKTKYLYKKIRARAVFSMLDYRRDVRER